jgi:RNA polymerase sigma-70 factor (ECF subfamily)
MLPRAASDDELVHAAAGGHNAAFTELMRRHRQWVCALMRAFVHDPEQAEDLAQEAFCRVYRHAGDYTAQGSFMPWLKRIAVNLAKDALRKQRKASMVSLTEIEETLVTDKRSDPMAALTSGVMREELRAAIQRLPDEQRLALVMHYFGEMTLPDIAWAMKCPVGTIKSRLFYALRRVRQTLAEQWEDEEGGRTP